MKKILTTILITALLAVSFTGCADKKVINGIEYDTYGLFNQSQKENPNVEYELSVGNIIWSVILSETVIAPIYFLGFSIFEPVGPKVTDPNLRGIVGSVPPSYSITIYDSNK